MRDRQPTCSPRPLSEQPRLLQDPWGLLSVRWTLEGPVWDQHHGRLLSDGGRNGRPGDGWNKLISTLLTEN